jgi:hypothetical protein
MPDELMLFYLLACGRYSSQTVSVIRIEVKGVPQQPIESRLCSEGCLPRPLNAIGAIGVRLDGRNTPFDSCSIKELG